MRCSEFHTLDSSSVENLLAAYGLELIRVSPGYRIPASFWGEPEAGLAASCLFVRHDTPSHSLLHEAAHYVCMTSERRKNLWRDAGGEVEEENGTCYLQVLLADCLPELGSDRVLRDMDEWGYTFREGSAAQWFSGDGRSARDWLMVRGLIDANGKPAWRLREFH